MIGLAEGFRSGYGMREESKERKRRQEWEDEQRGRQRAQWGREDAARSQLDQLAYDQQYGVAQPGTDNSYDIAEAKRLGMQAPTSTLQRQPLKQSQMAGRLGQAALTLGDTKGFMAANQQQRQFEEDEIIAQTMAADPDPQLARYLNGNHRSITVGEPDEYGFRPMSVVRKDGSAMFMNLSQADQKKLAAANALMERNPQRAMQMIGEVNKDLAQSVATEFQMQMGVGKEENDATARRLTAQHQGAALEQQGEYQRGMLGVARQRAAADSARAQRESAALSRLEMGDRLGQEAAGYAQGLHVARGLGKEGQAAAQIYGQHLIGANTRLRALGLQTHDPYGKPRANPGDHAKILADYINAGLSPAEAMMRADELTGVSTGPSLEDLAATLREASARKTRPDRVTEEVKKRTAMPASALPPVSDSIRAGQDRQRRSEHGYGLQR